MSKIMPLSLLGAALLLLLSGCGMIYKPTGYLLTHYSEDEVLPYALGSGDLNKTACGSGRSLGQLVGSFAREIPRPSRMLLSTNSLAGLCSETKAQQADLRYLVAIRHGKPEAAQNANIMAQRLYRRTALRRYQVYKDTVNAFGKLGDGDCPDLSNYMGTDTTNLEFLVGVLTSVQGVLSDIKGGTTVGIPQDIAAKTARASQCLDNHRWWGVPDALQAVVWISVPGAVPKHVDPWAQLKQAADVGGEQGMPLAAALYAIAAQGEGDLAREKDAIRQVAKIYNSGKTPEDYLLFSEVAYSETLYLSDRIWIKKTGHRTPGLLLGTFPGDQPSGGGNVDAGSFLD